MANTVKVRLRKPPRVFTFLSKNIELKRDEPCVVRTDRGVEYGVCVLPPEDIGDQAERRFKMQVLRRATHHDQVTHRQITDDEERAVKMCTDKIRERELPMRLVECEYSFDRKKIIFYFTAEDRVDFRELVKDLAQELKARIELRHIQVRDQAKLVGGIGTCGRELCCTTWMREFMPISMKMAKKQNLSLNPSKISGQCGRLMCCLSYEYERYGDAKRKARPKPEKIREEMEANPDKAAELIQATNLKDGPEKTSSEDKPRSERPRGDRSQAREGRGDKPLSDRPRRDRSRRGRDASRRDRPPRDREAAPAKEDAAETTDKIEVKSAAQPAPPSQPAPAPETTDKVEAAPIPQPAPPAQSAPAPPAEAPPVIPPPAPAAESVGDAETNGETNATGESETGQAKPKRRGGRTRRKKRRGGKGPE